MKLEQQVCSLENSKKLKEIGIKQESLWHWVKNEFNEYVIISDSVTRCDCMNIICSAFTVAELGELLPMSISIEICEHTKKISYLYTTKCLDEWDCYYAVNGIVARDIILHAYTEANSRARMLVYLINNKLLEAKCDTEKSQ